MKILEELIMSYEDYMCDESFTVHSSEEFLNDLSGEERDFLYNRSGMKACSNCGEFVSKLGWNNLTKTCNLCSKSEDHKNIRGSGSQATSNINADIDFFKEFNER